MLLHNIKRNNHSKSNQRCVWLFVFVVLLHASYSFSLILSLQTTSKNDSKQPVKKLSKHGFLEMIKSTAAAKSEDAKSKDNVNNYETKESTTTSQSSIVAQSRSKWSALQDDYMLKSKLQDWDKESSSDEEDDDDQQQQDWASDDEKEAPSAKKQRRVAAR